MIKIENLTAEEILKNELPIEELLKNSFYYPACYFDNGVINLYKNEIQSYIYCDYFVSEEVFLEKMNDFISGYKILAHRPLRPEELIPNGWSMKLPPNFNFKHYFHYKYIFKKPFAHWAVYEKSDRSLEDRSPNKISLIYTNGEGVATYQALYWSNRKTAKALAIICPGSGFGGNWTHFETMNGPLGWVVLNNAYGKPDTIFFGGEGFGYYNFHWDNYKQEKIVSPYYYKRNPPYGVVTVWKSEKKERFPFL